MSLDSWERQKKMTIYSCFLMMIFNTTCFHEICKFSANHWVILSNICIFEKTWTLPKIKKGNVSKKLKHQSKQEAKRNISKSVIGMKVLRLRPSARVKANEDLESIGTFCSPPKISWKRSRDSDFKRKIPIHALWSLNLWGTLWIFEGFCEG